MYFISSIFMYACKKQNIHKSFKMFISRQSDSMTGDRVFQMRNISLKDDNFFESKNELQKKICYASFPKTAPISIKDLKKIYQNTFYYSKVITSILKHPLCMLNNIKQDRFKCLERNSVCIQNGCSDKQNLICASINNGQLYATVFAILMSVSAIMKLKHHPHYINNLMLSKTV